jgi:S1-C subfamily serine protease
MELEKIEKLHQEVLWTTVRVRSDKAGGSGTVVWSDKDKEGKYHTYVLTCEHVIDDLIKIEKKWDEIAKVERKMEVLGKPRVQIFYYENYSRCKGSSGEHRAEIVAYSKEEDIALLELERYETPIEYVASMFPRGKLEEIHVFDKVHCVGAAMGHEPIATEGIISYMDEIIDGKEYWMSTAQSIFGNSGGAVFRYSKERDRYEFLGMPARITVAMYGFSADAITHMGFFVPINRIYKFLDDNCYQFIYDPEYTYEKCQELREEKKKERERLLLAMYGRVESS